MPITFKIKVENLIIVATDCDMLGRVANTPAKQRTFRLRSEELQRISSAVRADLIQRELSDVEFLIGIAARLRDVATSCTQQGIRAELLAMANDMEDRVSERKH